MYTLPWPATGCARAVCDLTGRMDGRFACGLGTARLGRCIARMAAAADARYITGWTLGNALRSGCVIFRSGCWADWASLAGALLRSDRVLKCARAARQRIRSQRAPFSCSPCVLRAALLCKSEVSRL